MTRMSYPKPQGLYHPSYEHDACGVGFAVDIQGRQSHATIERGLQILASLSHRAGAGADNDSGDGAGMLLQIPHTFLSEEFARLGIDLPHPGAYGIAMLFMPREEGARARAENFFAGTAEQEGLTVMGWRDVPVRPDVLGTTAEQCRPAIRQAVLISQDPKAASQDAFERQLFMVRKLTEKQLDGSFYAASMSSKTIVYKGMVTAEQLPRFYPDLRNEKAASALCLVHSRFSTNTFPSWERAHPIRYIAHNGEINTLRGNMNWMNARESVFKSPVFGQDLQRVFPILHHGGSDSAIFDNALEFLHLNGRSLPHAVMMMIPEPWSGHEQMEERKRAFYEYHSTIMEPWDGPALVAFTDGTKIGAALDRNGLRPSRYCVTHDQQLIMASEAGVLDIPADAVQHKGRLKPGMMLLVDTSRGRIVEDHDLKQELASSNPYQEWLQRGMIDLDSLQAPEQQAPENSGPPLLQKQKAFGCTNEDLHLILTPLARDSQDPVGSMGADAPLAVLSERPQLLYSYFKQLFAQVTNPPIDSIREALITSTVTYLGAEGDLLSPGPESCRRVRTDSPILSSGQIAKLSALNGELHRTDTLSLVYSRHDGGLKQALDDLFAKADEAISRGSTILILSDRAVGPNRISIPALLAAAGLHHHLIRQRTRTKVSIVLDSGEPREVHHFAVLLGYGVDAVHPYLAYETIADLVARDKIKDVRVEQACLRYRSAVLKGVIKTMAKMGISTIQSYRGAQIFEALGIHSSVIERYFTGTASRIEGIGLAEIEQENRLRHDSAFHGSAASSEPLHSGGLYQWRRDGERHMYNPDTIYKLQQACRTNDYALYKEYAEELRQGGLYTLRHLLEFNDTRQSVPLQEVESTASILKRFKSGAMSYGSLSEEAHESLAIAMNRIGGKSNTGEGGEDPKRFQRDPNGDSRCSAIKQVASGRFGVTSEYLTSAAEIQIKMAQGAKPGEGGQLPGRKVYPWIAKTRHSTPGVGLISPPPHHDIYSIEDLAQLIHDLKNANRQAGISVKLVSAVGVGTIAAGVAKGRADLILISGHDGGTGASPRGSIQHAGLPWELGLAEAHQTLLLNGLRSRVALETDGKLMSGRDVAVAALLGAEEFGFSTLPLVALGCIMMRVCNKDTCPVGVATQDPRLRKNFQGDPAHVVNLLRFIAADLRETMASLGFRTIAEMVGRTEVLKQRTVTGHWKAAGIDLSSLLEQSQPWTGLQSRTEYQDHNLEASLDARQLLSICRPAIEQNQPVEASLPIDNTCRVVGTIVGSEVTRHHGAAGLPDSTISLSFSGSAGQSFGAFIPQGMNLRLEGEANDYMGKGLSGGRIAVFPPAAAAYKAHENTIIGNVALYGATSGEAYVRGLAGERFCVRNSGVRAVAEGVGDHGCEYMTGGRVVILGPTGRNFAAGMSGGIAYVWDREARLPAMCGGEGVLLETAGDADDQELIKDMLQKHLHYTGSTQAQYVLAHWEEEGHRFVKVIPKDYKRMLEAFERFQDKGLDAEEAVMEAFQRNSRDLARVSGS